jgi:2-dehydropantoate 2-reductase
LLHKDSIIVLVQNGLGIEENLAIDFPNHSIAGGLAFICSSRIAPGHIAHFDFGSIRFGFHNNGKQQILEQVCKDLIDAGIKAEFTHNLSLARWQKLVWNIPYNGMTVALNTTTEALMKNPSSRQLIQDLMTEVVEAANVCGAVIKHDFVQKMMVTTDRMKPYAPSMKLDFDAKRPMEIEAIYTNTIETAKVNGYSMHKTSMLEHQLNFIQNSSFLKTQ